MTTIALVGCAHIHTPGFINAIKKHPQISVKRVWDPDPRIAARRAADLQSQADDDVNAIWKDKDISAVVICSQTNLHQQLVLAGARARKSLFVEKPLGMGSRDGYKMADAIEKAGVLFTTGYFQRGNPINLFLRRQVNDGAFGTITRVRGSNCHSGALGGWFDSKPEQPWEDWRWMADPAVAGVGAFGDLGTHSLDILIWIMGEVTSATAAVDAGTNRYDGTDEFGEGLMKFQQGAIGTLAAGWNDVANPVAYEIAGTQGHAVVMNGQLFFQSQRVDGADGKQPWTRLPEPQPAGFEAFLNAIQGRTDGQLVSAREAAYRSAVMEAMYLGAKKGKWMGVKGSMQPPIGADAKSNADL